MIIISDAIEKEILNSFRNTAKLMVLMYKKLPHRT